MGLNGTIATTLTVALDSTGLVASITSIEENRTSQRQSDAEPRRPKKIGYRWGRRSRALDGVQRTLSA